MSKRIFNEEQITMLSNNNNVTKCSEKSITYSRQFKINAVKQYHEKGLSSSQIFTEAGFDLSVIGRKTPKDRVSDWNTIYRIKGEGGLVETRGGGGGRPKTKDITPEYRIKRLEAEVAYLKAENDFLAKLRAKRRTE